MILGGVWSLQYALLISPTKWNFCNSQNNEFGIYYTILYLLYTNYIIYNMYYLGWIQDGYR